MDIYGLSRLLEGVVESVEEELGGKVAFGAIGGSYSLGLQNDSSDIDVYMMFEGIEEIGVRHIEKKLLINDTRIEADFMCVSYQQACRELREYAVEAKRYPTKWYYSEEEKLMSLRKKDFCRPDFIRSLFYRILLSDYIIGEKRARELYPQYGDSLIVSDMVDFEFTRIYGNYEEKIKNQNYVPVRKYLYTIREILTSEYLLKTGKKPPMDFLNLLDASDVDRDVKEAVLQCMDVNREAKADKKKILVPKMEILNEYIEIKVDFLAQYLKREADRNVLWAVWEKK